MARGSLDVIAPVVAFIFFLATFIVLMEIMRLNHLLSVSLSLDPDSDSTLVFSASSGGNSTTTNSSSSSSNISTSDTTTAAPVLVLHSEVQFLALGSIVAISSLLILGLLVSIANFLDVLPFLCAKQQAAAERLRLDDDGAVTTRTSLWKGLSKSVQLLANILLSGGCACLMLLSFFTMISWGAVQDESTGGRGFSDSAVRQSVVSFWVLTFLLCPVQLWTHYRVAPATRKTTRLRLLLSSPQRMRGSNRGRNNNVGIGPRPINDEDDDNNTNNNCPSSYSYSYYYRDKQHTEELDEDAAQEERSTVAAMMLLFTGGTEYEQRIFRLTKWGSFAVGILCCVFNFIALCSLAASFDQGLFETPLARGAASSASASTETDPLVKRLTVGLVVQLCLLCAVGCIIGLYNALEWVLVDTESDNFERRHQHQSAANNGDDGEEQDSSDEDRYDEEGRWTFTVCGFLRGPFSCYGSVILPLFCINTATRKRIQIFANRFVAGGHSLSSLIVVVTLVTSLIAKSRSSGGFTNPDVVIAFWIFLGLASAAQMWSWALVPSFLLSHLLVELQNHEDEREEEREQVERHRLLRGVDFGAVIAEHNRRNNDGRDGEEKDDDDDDNGNNNVQDEPVHFDPRDASHLLHDVPPGKQFLDPWRPRNHVVPQPAEDDEIATFVLSGPVDEEDELDGESAEQRERGQRWRRQQQQEQPKKSKHEMRPEELEEMEFRHKERVRVSVFRALANLRHIDPERARHWATLSHRAQRWRESAGYLFWQRYEKVLMQVVARNGSRGSGRRKHKKKKQQQQWQRGARTTNDAPGPRIVTSDNEPTTTTTSSSNLPPQDAATAEDKKNKKRIRKRRNARARALALVKLLGNFHALRVMSSSPTTAPGNKEADQEEQEEEEEEATKRQSSNAATTTGALDDEYEDEDEQQRALAFPPCKRLVSAMSLLSASADTVPALFARFVGDDDVNTARHLRAGLYTVQLCIGGVWRRVHLDSLVPVQPPEHIADLGVEPEEDYQNDNNDHDRSADDGCCPSSSGGAAAAAFCGGGNDHANSSKDSTNFFRRLLSPHCSRELPEIYPALLHKAAAKLLGSFAAVSTELGDALDEIHDISGVPVERFSSWNPAAALQQLQQQHVLRNRCDGGAGSAAAAAAFSSSLLGQTTSAFVEMEEVLMRFDGRIEDMSFYPVVVLTSRRFAEDAGGAAGGEEVNGKKKQQQQHQKKQQQQQHRLSVDDGSIEALTAPVSRGGRGLHGGAPCRVMAAVSCPADRTKAAALVQQIKRYKRRVNLAAWSHNKDGLDSSDDENRFAFSSDDDQQQQQQQQHAKNQGGGEEEKEKRRSDSPVLDMSLDGDDEGDDDKEQQQQEEEEQKQGHEQQHQDDAQEEPLRFLLLDDDSLLGSSPEAEFAALRRVIDRRFFPDSHLRRLIAAAAQCHDRHGLFPSSASDKNDDNTNNRNKKQNNSAEGVLDDEEDEDEGPFGDDSGIDAFGAIVPLRHPLPIMGFGRFNKLVATDRQLHLRKSNSEEGEEGEDSQQLLKRSDSAAYLCRDAIFTHLMRSGICVADDLSVCSFADARAIARLFFVEWTEAAARVFCRAGCAHVPVTGLLDDVAALHVALGEENGVVEHAANEAVRYWRMKYMYRRLTEERRRRRARRKRNFATSGGGAASKKADDDDNDKKTTNADDGPEFGVAEESALGVDIRTADPALAPSRTGSMISRRSGRSSPYGSGAAAAAGSGSGSGSGGSDPRSPSPSPVNPYGSSSTIGGPAKGARQQQQQPLSPNNTSTRPGSSTTNFDFLDASFFSFDGSVSMSPSAFFNKVNGSATDAFFEANPHLQRRWIDQEMATFVGVALRTPSWATRSLPLISPVTDIRLPNRWKQFGATSDWVLKVNVVSTPAAAAAAARDNDAAAADALRHGSFESRRKAKHTTTTVFVGLHQQDARNDVASLLTDGEPRQKQQQHPASASASSTSMLPACGCTYHPCMVSVLRVPKTEEQLRQRRRRERKQRQEEEEEEEGEEGEKEEENNNVPSAAAAHDDVEASLVITSEKQSNSNSFASDRDVYLRIELEGAPAAEGGETYLIVPRMQSLHQHLFYLSEQEEQQIEAARRKRNEKLKQQQQQQRQQQQRQRAHAAAMNRDNRPSSTPLHQQQKRQQPQRRAASATATAAAPGPRPMPHPRPQQQQRQRQQTASSSSANPMPVPTATRQQQQEDKKHQQQQQQQSAEAAGNKTHTVHNRDGSTYTISLEPQVTTVHSPQRDTVVERCCYQVWQTVPAKSKNRKGNNSNSDCAAAAAQAGAAAAASSVAGSVLVPRRQVLLNARTKSAPFVLSLLVPKAVSLQLNGIRVGDSSAAAAAAAANSEEGTDSSCSVTVTLVQPSQLLAQEVASQCQSPLEQLARRLKSLPEPAVVAAMVEEAKLSILTVSREAVEQTAAGGGGGDQERDQSPFSMEAYLSPTPTARNEKRHFFVEQILSDVPASVSGKMVPLAQVDSEAIF